MENIKRREAIRRTAWIMGGVLSAPTIAGILNGCTPKPELTWTPSFFTEDQARLIMEISETIIPKTDTAGAKEIGVPGFIEEMVSIVWDEDRRKGFTDGLMKFNEECKKETGDDFVALAAAKKKEFCQKKDAEAKAAPWGQKPVFWSLKELTIVGYYTSEHGATEELQYIAIPVEQHGCQPLSETGNGKTWATS